MRWQESPWETGSALFIDGQITGPAIRLRNNKPGLYKDVFTSVQLSVRQIFLGAFTAHTSEFVAFHKVLQPELLTGRVAPPHLSQPAWARTSRPR
jgi:hypothetical protein